MTPIRSVMLSCGAYLPEKIVTNADLSRTLDTSDEWITERTGIKQRHVAADGELTSDIGLASARQALERAEVDAKDIDLIVLATTTPDNTFPATAVAIQDQLGITQGAAFDVQAVCSGFVFALATADNFLRCGQFQRALVIGAETYSRILDWEDRSTSVLFGDGGGAVVLEAQKLNGVANQRGIIASKLRSDGRYRNQLYVDGGPSSTQTVGHLRMNGREVFRHAVTNISNIVKETLADTNYTIDDVDWFVPHQANKRILDGTARKIGLSDRRIVITVDKHANTSAASIPLALNEAFEDGRLQDGNLVLMEAMGGGFTWGAVLVRW